MSGPNVFFQLYFAAYLSTGRSKPGVASDARMPPGDESPSIRSGADEDEARSFAVVL